MHLMFFVVWWIITSSSSHVVEQVMIFHEECLQGNYDMVSKLQIACSIVQPASDQCQKVIYVEFFVIWNHAYIRGNLGSKMALTRKHANNKFLWVGIQEPIEFQ